MNIAVDDVFNVVDWFLHVKPMTHKKLQKLLYFSYGIYLVQNNKSRDNIKNVLFFNDFEAWVHGPVEPSVFRTFKYNGINLLSKDDIISNNFSYDILRALNKTMELYGNIDADELEDITHQHISWINARNGVDSIMPSNNKLDDKDIFDSFKNIINE